MSWGSISHFGETSDREILPKMWKDQWDKAETVQTIYKVYLNVKKQLALEYF